MRIASLVLPVLLMTTVASAADLDSSSFMLRGGHPNAGSNGWMEAAVPTVSGIASAGGTVGEGITHPDALGAAVSIAAGYWPVENALALGDGVTPVPEPGFASGIAATLGLLFALARGRRRPALPCG